MSSDALAAQVQQMADEMAAQADESIQSAEDTMVDLRLADDAGTHWVRVGILVVVGVLYAALVFASLWWATAFAREGSDGEYVCANSAADFAEDAAALARKDEVIARTKATTARVRAARPQATNADRAQLAAANARARQAATAAETANQTALRELANCESGWALEGDALKDLFQLMVLPQATLVFGFFFGRAVAQG